MFASVSLAGCLPVRALMPMRMTIALGCSASTSYVDRGRVALRTKNGADSTGWFPEVTDDLAAQSLPCLA